MKKNEGAVDRIIRVVLGILLLIWAFAGLQGTGAWVAGIVGAILLVTGLIGYCALYSLFGIRTNKTPQE